MKKLSHEQKKIIYIAAIALAFLLFFWIFIYLPQSRRLVAIQKKLKTTEEEISRIQRITQGRNLEEAVRSLNLELNQAITKLPSKVEDIIRILSQEAKRLKIDIEVIDPADDVETLMGRVSGFNLKELPISIKLVSDYKALGEYLNSLVNKLPLLITIRQLNIQTGGIGNPDVNVDLQISVYLS